MEIVAANCFAYVGSFTPQFTGIDGEPMGAAAEGLSVFVLDGSTGALEAVQVLGGMRSPSFVAAHPLVPAVYAVERELGPDQRDASALSASPRRREPEIGNAGELLAGRGDWIAGAYRAADGNAHPGLGRLRPGGSGAFEMSTRRNKAVPALKVGPSLADQAYGALRDMITGGDFEPGQRLTERSLADLLGVSPTPVREAISRLEHERLLLRPDGRVLEVARPTPERVRQMYLIHCALRSVAARLAAEVATQAELDAIARTHQQAQELQRQASPEGDKLEGLLRLNRKFHQQIEAAAHNPSLVDMIATADAFDWRTRVRTIRASLGEDLSVVMHDHQALVDALIARDAETAETLMRNHGGRSSHLYFTATTGEDAETADQAG
jgi:DNA-binding GntR family transcriptional regulator